MIWIGVLVSMTVAYGMALWGIRKARQQDVASHAKWMGVSCFLVAIWVLVYAGKQFMFGRDHFGGTVQQYWVLYIPILLVHTGLAMTTIGLGATNMVFGFRKLRNGTGVGAMVGGVSRHRRLGQTMSWTFGGTLLTAYVVYAMLFLWFPAG